jgi:hypothetical protein
VIRRPASKQLDRKGRVITIPNYQFNPPNSEKKGFIK